MSKKIAFSIALGGALLAACAARGTGPVGDTGTVTLPNMPDLQITYVLPNHQKGTVSTELPSEGLGAVKDPFWKATLGGYTQQQFSQALGFPPGTKITIKNISASHPHTLNAVGKISGPPAVFPKNPKLSLSPSGGKFGKNYASGVISPGKSVTVVLGKAGNYLIGCAFHYAFGMQDVFVVAPNATPGPQATKPAQ